MSQLPSVSSALEPPAAPLVRPKEAYAALLVFLMIGVYAVVLWRLGQIWFTNDDMSHGPFVPILAGYIVYRRWPQLTAIKAAPNLWGLVLLILGAMMLCIGPPSLPTFAFMTRTAFVVSLTGLILYVRGWETLKFLTYPMMILLLMIPVPGFVLQQITMPLQFIASKLAEQLLDLVGFSVLREGNILFLPGQTLSVVEACSGLRSLLSLSFLGQTYIYLFDGRIWARWVIAIVIVPIAILANAGRIVASGIMGQYHPSWVHGLMHESTGWVVFVVAFIIIMTFHLVVIRRFDKGSVAV
jgi:exosortase